MTKSLQLGNNVKILVKILPQNEKNRERLLQKFSTAEKEIVRVLYFGNHPKSGKTVNIYMESFVVNDKSGTINCRVYDRYY